ncbi:MAG: ribonuclease III domain-containing protein [Vescimonas sp.]|uniref:Mini-ribonuclease 3 n=1 Tax=Vescimonas sp. TaxID=2892404 RepID=UPI002A91649E|nr:ribonuclease III domain-containing protein [Vescimonas sp.]MCI6678033.1 ribonuclease III [Oscillibacter sp.]MDY5334115.1 ribonuclease III domain-containing protein [Vescimonas sp.]
MNYFEPHLTPDELRAISAIGLAHMGDAVYETLVRTWLCVHGKATGKELHRTTIALVCAQKQAELAQRVLPQLTEEELAVYKRGRNANVHAMPRSATPAQYHAATGLECLMGWLYLRGDKERAEQLFRAMMEEE